MRTELILLTALDSIPYEYRHKNIALKKFLTNTHTHTHTNTHTIKHTHTHKKKNKIKHTHNFVTTKKSLHKNNKIKLILTLTNFLVSIFGLPDHGHITRG